MMWLAKICARCGQYLRKHIGEGGRCPNHAQGYNFVSRLLSPGAERLLKAMAQPVSTADEYDHELVFERGAGWWIDTNRTSGQVARQLIVLCLISVESGSRLGEYECWRINEEGRAILADPKYRPKILDVFLKLNTGT